MPNIQVTHQVAANMRGDPQTALLRQLAPRCVWARHGCWVHRVVDGWLCASRGPARRETPPPPNPAPLPNPGVQGHPSC